jgi:uncharacterized protein
MIDVSRIDYSELDHPEILAFLFHPRREWSEPMSELPFEELLVPVDKNVSVGGRFYVRNRKAPTILYFHGNGEIVADYEDMASLYLRAGINFLPVDYRGYGKSTGKPTVTAMMRDCHVIFEFVQDLLRERSFSGPFLVMGRSLGSASVLELISCHESRIHGLIVESGFAFAEPLLRLIGIDTRALGFREERGFRNLDKIRTFPKPTLVIHAEQDHIIPFSDGRALFDACPAADKRFLPVPGANHNDIFLRGMPGYMDAVRDLAQTAAAGG